MTVKLSPLFQGSQFDGNGLFLAGGKLYWYLAGTTTPATTYTDATGVTPQTNPITLNVRGAPTLPIWLTQDTLYKAVLQDAYGNTIQTIDNISGVNGISPPAPSEWQAWTGSATYINSTTFSVATDVTSILSVQRRIKANVTGGAYYGFIITSTYNAGTGLTTITTQNDSIGLDSGLSTIYYSILSATHPSVPADPYGAIGFLNGLIAAMPTITNIDLASPPSSDVVLRVGDSAVVRFSGVASAPLHIGTTQGIYSIEMAILNNGSFPILTFNPNNTSYAGAFDRSGLQMTDPIPTGATTNATGDNSITFKSYQAVSANSNGPLVLSALISTYTAAKTWKYSSGIRGGVASGAGIWNDTTTAWNSLGTLLPGLAASLTGTVVVKRLA